MSTSNSPIKLIECPRDAMQGLDYFIDTEDKIKYLNLLLKVGFDTLDFGSFVSPKAIPQMADTALVLEGLDYSSDTKLLAIVANLRGAEDALKYDRINYIGYPFSISETFQKRNTNSTIKNSLVLVEELLDKSSKANKELVIYLSMAFGNPYGDVWDTDIVQHYCEELVKRSVKTIALSDTTGVSTAHSITEVFGRVCSQFQEIEVGVHLHSSPDTWEEKVDAAYKNGCRRFDSAIKGFGGCPMATDKLIGNIATENLLNYFERQNLEVISNRQAFTEAFEFSASIFR